MHNCTRKLVLTHRNFSFLSDIFIHTRSSPLANVTHLRSLYRSSLASDNGTCHPDISVYPPSRATWMTNEIIATTMLDVIHLTLDLTTLPLYSIKLQFSFHCLLSRILCDSSSNRLSRIRYQLCMLIFVRDNARILLKFCHELNILRTRIISLKPFQM